MTWLASLTNKELLLIALTALVLCCIFVEIMNWTEK